MQSRLTVTSVVLLIASGLLGARCAAQEEIVLSITREKLGKYEKVELQIEVQREYNHPFDPCEVRIDLAIETPDGGSLTAPAFYCQGYERQDFDRGGKTVAWYYPVGTGSWRARFAPTQLGTYAAHAALTDRLGQVLSSPVRFECVASSRKGFLRASREDPRFLEFTEGEPFFAIGQNLAFVGEGQYVNVPKAEEIFGKLADNGANFVRIWTCCKDWALAIEAEKSAWTRSWTRESPVVPLPGTEEGPDARKCVKLEGDDGASITVSPSHPVGLRPEVRYAFTGRFKTERCKALQLRVGNNQWELPARPVEQPGWQTFGKEFVTGANDRSLGRVTFSLVGPGTAWLNDLSLKEANGGAELLWEADVNRPARGYYNQLDCFMLDQLVEAAERNGIYLMLCIITRDLYMDLLSTVDSPEYRQATEDAKKLMRYAVARWGYSTNVAAWEYFNEMDPGKPTDRFYEEVGEYLELIDVYHHLRTTSTWHPSARDCRHPQLDIAQEHHYMRPGDDDFKDEVRSVIEQTRFLRAHAPDKPALIGEFGLATDKWGLSNYMKQDTEGVHFHNCLWSSAFAGSSGTAMFWWWDQLDRQEAYRHYKPLSAFLADVSFAGLHQAHATSSNERIRVLGRQGDTCAYLWLCDEEATWWNRVVEKRRPDDIDGATIDVSGLQHGRYSVQWWDTHAGRMMKSEEASADNGLLHLRIPPFSDDIACRISAF